MANIIASAVPKETSLLWLQKPNKHRAYALFNGDLQDDDINPRRCDLNLLRHIRTHSIHHEVRHHIAEAGFSGVCETGIHNLDHALIIALVERWRPETHTFHFPTGEATVTLQDIQVLWGLPINGPAVSGIWRYNTTGDWIDYVEQMLGFRPEPTEIKKGKIKINTLVRHLDDNLEANDVAYRQRARIYILALLGGHLFSDTSSYDVSLNYLQHIEDLSRQARLSWGSAVLASLYRNLCQSAGDYQCKSIAGPVTLLMYWVWERIPHIAPKIIHGRSDPYNFLSCYASRWNYSLSHTDTPAHVLVSARSALTTLNQHQFKWRPYAEILNQLPYDCREGQNVWAYTGWLVFWHVVEPHPVNRVARQFGYIQEIPDDRYLLSPRSHEKRHKQTLRGRANENWVIKNSTEIAVWEDRHNRQFVGQSGIRTHQGYMSWYYDRTVIFITNPGRQIDANRMPDTGGVLQNYHEGLRHIHDRAQHLMDSQPGSSQMMNEFVQLPRNLMQYGHYDDRFRYGSQQFSFPVPGYQPNPPTPPVTSPYEQHTGGGYQPMMSLGGGYNLGSPGGFFDDTFMNYYSPPQDFNYNTENPITTYPENTPQHIIHQPIASRPIDQRRVSVDSSGRRSAFRTVSPIPMGNFSESGPSNRRNDDPDEQATSHAEDVEDVQEELGRGRRNRVEPRCGTGGHRRWFDRFRR